MLSPNGVRPGVYAITPDAWPASRILDTANVLLDAGVALLQLRSKHLTPGEREALGVRLLPRCVERSVPLIINDDAALAARIGATGVHIGRDDGSIEQARRLLGTQAWVGVSCYADAERAAQLAHAGASYVAFGAVYPTTSKETPHRAPLSLFREWSWTAVPTVAIGGINADNAAPLLTAGARWLAMIGALWNAPDPAAVVRRIHALIDQEQLEIRFDERK